MLVKGVYKVGQVLSVMMDMATMLGGFFLSLPIVMEQVTSDGRPLVWWLVASPVLWMLVVWLVVRPTATVVHEAGHAWACLVLGVKISAIYLGNDVPNRPRFTVGKITITLTGRFGGRVEYDGTQSAARNAFITAAGPLAKLLAEAVALAPAADLVPEAAAATQFQLS